MDKDSNPLAVDHTILESPLPREVLTELYACMLRTRALARRLRFQTLAEAAIAGALQNVEASDVAVSARPDPVLEVLRGTNLSDFTRPKAAVKNGRPQSSSQYSRVVSAGVEAVAGVAAGMAMSARAAGSGTVVVAFVHGTETRGAAWEQATEFASAQRCPVVFVADWTTVRRARAPKAREPWPLPHIPVDGRDVIAVYRVTKEAISAARRGHGPTLVDAVNFLSPGARGRDERDPIASFRAYLRRHDAWSESWSADLENQLRAEIGGRSRAR